MTASVVTFGVVAGALAASILSALRWLRVCQREHYIGGSCARFALRWWQQSPNPILVGIIVGGLFVTAVADGFSALLGGIAASAAVGLGPIGLGLKGRSSALAWTSRLRRVAAGAAVPMATSMAVGLAVHPALAVAGAALTPLWVDVAAVVMAPLEHRLGSRWVADAGRTLQEVAPRVVAVTGSYGKTSTKLAIAHLAAGVATTVASPASFNNRMGLARAINEGLTPGTELFVAEMGTYGPGEIAALCSFIPPTVSVMTAIGPVHLERMQTEEAIVAAKREILHGGAVAVVNVDHPLLAAVADEESNRRRVVTCSSSQTEADVYVDASSGDVWVDGSKIGTFDPQAIHAGNLACAVGAILALDIDVRAVAGRLGSVPTAPHRQTTTRSERGFVIIDDTFNANPAGAARALEALEVAEGRKVVVTPGMVELGARQQAENEKFANAAANVASDLIVVGQTNRAALLRGARASGQAEVIVADTRESAVEWVRANLGVGDIVLYENDLPDHYP